MYLVSKSSIYVGTSLHGLITAQSYNIPFIALNKGISKIDNYCKTWAKGVSLGSIDFNDIEQLEELFNSWNYTRIKELTEQQKTQVYNNFNTIYTNLM